MVNQRVEIPVACDLNALTLAERERRHTLAAALMRAIVSSAELANGFELRLDSTRLDLSSLAEWVALERRCCPFLHFRIELEPADGEATLALTGADGVKEFLRTSTALRPGVRQPG